MDLGPNSIFIKAKQNVSSAFDLDKNKHKYNFITDLVKVTFTGLIPYTAEHVKFLLLFDSHKKQLLPKYYQRPDLLSNDEYGTEQFDWILMYVNSVFSYEDFTMPYVYVPTMDAISNIVDMQEQNAEPTIITENVL